MSYTVQNLKTELEAIFHGTTLNQVVAVDELIYRAGRQLLLDIDPQETKRIALLANPLFDSVYDYASPTDLKGNKIIDIRPQVNRQADDIAIQQYNRDFDLSKITKGGQFTTNISSGIKTIRISLPNLQQGVTIDTCDQLTGWAGNANAANLAIDNVNFASGSGALKFDGVAGANPTAVYVQKTITALDLSTHKNQSTIFAYVYIPNPANVVTVSLLLASAGGSYSKTVAATQQGNAFSTGWNLLAFDWASAVAIGSPDASAITSVRLTINTNGTATTGFRVDGIVSRLGKYFEIEYYSKFLFRDALTSAWQETVTDDSNIINLDTESYNLLLDQCAIKGSQQIQGFSSVAFDASFFQNDYTNNVQRYKNLYKSEVQKPQSRYYNLKRGGYNDFVGFRQY